MAHYVYAYVYKNVSVVRVTLNAHRYKLAGIRI